jgi:hypothetical protein
VEAQFSVRQVTSAINKYNLVMAALMEAQMDLVSNVASITPIKEMYKLVKAALVDSHSMTSYITMGAKSIVRRPLKV